MKRYALQLARLLAIGVIAWGLYGLGRGQRPKTNIALDDVREFFPAAARVVEPSSPEDWSRVLDAGGRELGTVVSTSPLADDVRGYGGPTPTLVAVGPDGKIVGIKLLANHETPGNLESIRDEGYTDRWKGVPWREAAGLKVDAVSGSTVTCTSVSSSIHRRLALAAGEGRETGAGFSFSWREAVSLALIVAALVMSFWPRLAKLPGARVALQLACIGWLGFCAASFVSMALVAGWAGQGVPWRSAPVAVVLVALAVLMPIIFGRQFYCTYVCPHGAAQELCGRVSRWKRPLPEKVAKWLRMLPGAVLAVLVTVALLHLAMPLEWFEPFSAYLLGAAGLIPVALAIVGLVASFFVTRAWCNHGCATGALLRFLRRPGAGEGLGLADLVLGVLVVLALAVRFRLFAG